MKEEKNELQLAFLEYTKLVALLREQTKVFVEIGRVLKGIRDNKSYELIGNGGYDTFQDFLNNPEIGIRPSTAYLYIRVYEYYVERLHLPESTVIEVPLNRLQRLLPGLKEKTDTEAKRIVSDMAHLTNWDYDIVLQEEGLDPFERPKIFKDKETGRYIIEFLPISIFKIVNAETRETIYEGIKDAEIIRDADADDDTSATS